MIDQPIAHHYQLKQHEYVIVDNFRTTYPICLEGFLILDIVWLTIHSANGM
jgi:hypothetical protein